MKHGRTTFLILLLSAPACGAWSPPPPGDHGATGSTTALADPSTTAAAGIPWLPAPDWGDPKIHVDDPATTTSAGSSGTPPADTSGGPTEPTLDLAALRLSEVLADPEGKDGGPSSPEFVEIAHVGDVGVALAGLVIRTRGWPELRAGDLGLADQTLHPGERLLVLHYASAADVPDPPVARQDGVLSAAFAAPGALRNADGGVVLGDLSEAPGDALIYGAPAEAPLDVPGTWDGPPAPAPASGEALCRLDPTIDTDQAGDWVACAPSPGVLPVADETTGEPPLPAEVVIVEVLSNPPGPAALEKHAEYVELLNLGPGAVDLAAWTVSDALEPMASGSDPLVHVSGDGGCAPSTCLAPGRRALLVGGAYEGPVGDALVLATDDTSLANAGLGNTEPVVLRDGEGALRSTYRAWEEPLSAPDPATEEAALTRVGPEAPDEPTNWHFTAPTPGA